MGSIAGKQRDGPEAWIFHRLPANNASEAIDGVLVLALDDNLGTSVEPRWDPSCQATVDGSEVTDGGWLWSEVTLEVLPYSHSASAGSAGANTRGCVGARTQGRRVSMRDG